MLLLPLAGLYRALTALRAALYARGILRVHRLEVPVIVVGNVVVGGAGKTPCTLALVEHLRAAGWQPGVVSRGHGRRGDGVVLVQPDTPAQEAGDEPLLIRRRSGVPVCVARRRVDAARALLASHPDVDILVCDDGMQHLALGRDLTVVVFDERGIGNGWPLPAGLLRQPWPSPRAADLALRQRREGAAVPPVPAAPGVPMFDALRRLAPHAIGPAGERIALSQLKDQPLTAVAGTARPEVFFDMLRACGLRLAGSVALPDHAPGAAYEAVLRTAAPPLVCTEKDAVKLFALLPEAGRPVQAWSVPLELQPEPAFFAAIDARLAAIARRRPPTG